MSKRHRCRTCELPIVWLSKRGWVHWTTHESASTDPAPHNAFPEDPKKAKNVSGG